jgi:hypothetical protein
MQGDSAMEESKRAVGVRERFGDATGKEESKGNIREIRYER